MSEPFATSDAIARAKEWLAAASSKWRLQTLQHRSRYNPKTGEYKQLPTRVRRFLNGTPAGMKAAVLQVLKESSPYKSPVFDLECDGLSYVPTNTFIRKDGVENASNGRDATYTIIQDLRLADDALDRFSFGDESSCSAVGETEYRWDEPDVEACPDGSQGVVYQVAGVSRDRETDLFSYQLRKVQALTQHMPPAVVQCDARKRVTVETWNNVYGEPGSFRMDPVRGASAKIAVPEPCEQADGTTVQVGVTENADCTYRVEVSRTESRVLDGQFSVYRDQYKVQETERVQNAPAPLDRQGVEYSGGVTRRYTSEPNDDGTWNNGIDTETERAVTSSTVEVRVLPRHTVRTRIDTNVPTAADSVPGGGYGSFKSTKTQGGLFVNEYVQYLRTHLGDLGLVCTDTAFVKTHETQETADAVPSGSHVPAASGGLVTTWNYDTDAEGVVVRRVRTELEHEVLNAVRRRTWGFLGTTSGFTHRSVSKSAMESLMASQPMGTSVEARMTNGALWDVDVQSFLRLTGQSLGLDCQKTVYQHVHEVAVSAAAIGEEASDAGGGMTHRRSFRLDTSTGAITQTDTTTHELEVPESRRVVRVTSRGKTVRTTRANTPSRPSDAAAPGETTEFEVTPGGRYNVTVEKTEPKAGAIAKECSADVFQEADSETRTQESASAEHVDEAGGGKYRERTQRLGDDGLWEVKDSKVTERRDVADGKDVSVNARGKRKTTRTRHKSSEPAEPGVDDAGKALRTQRTRGGLWDVEETTTEPRTGESAEECANDHFVHSHSSTSLAKSKPSGELPRGQDGKYKERASRLGDDGLWETRTTENTEHEVTGEVEVNVTSRGKRKTTIKRQTADSGTEPGADEAGRALRRTKTKGGLNNIEETTFEPRTQPNGKECSRDLFQHTSGKTELKREAASEHVQETSDLSGVYRERLQRLGDDGLWEVKDTEHEEKPVQRQREEVRVTRAGKVKRTTDVQVTDEGTEPQATVDDIGKERVVEKTRGGRRNVTKVEVEPIREETESRCEKDAFLHTDVKVKGVRQKGQDHVDEAGEGKYCETTYRLNDVGVWEETKSAHKEEQPDWTGREYVDAFGTTKVFEEMSNASEAGGKGGVDYSPEHLIRHVEAQMTKGRRYNVRTVEEKPTPVSSGHLHFEKETDKGLTIYYDFIVFRNQNLKWVKSEIKWVQDKVSYRGWSGSFANHPNISISPNKFGLWDGSISLTTTFTPKAWASGGSTRDDNYGDEYTVKDISFSPMSAGTSTSGVYILIQKITETHLRGGGVGKDELDRVLKGKTLVKGSMFSYHPSGQAFQYDIITKRTVEWDVQPASAAASKFSIQ